MSATLDYDLEAILALIRRWIAIETPTYAADEVNRLVDLIAADSAASGLVLERIPGRHGLGDALKLRTPPGFAVTDGPGILILSHLDTVHPLGTLQRLPCRIEGNRLYGPGTIDMKGCAALAWHGLVRLVAAGRRPLVPITLLLTPDEEVGSPISRPLIESEAGRARWCLVTEAARAGGHLVTSRKGVGIFTLRLHGRPSHAGVAHAAGISAVTELAHHILALEALTDYARGITVNVGMVSGGSAVNVVPETAEARIDLRVPDPAAAAELVARISGLSPVNPRIELEVTGGLNRPPYVKDAGIAALLARAQAAGREVGLDLEDVAQTGGGSDGNFTAALGVPTLDGLGPEGGGAHTMEEHLLISSLLPRARLLERLLLTLD